MGSSPMKDVHEETKKALALKVRDGRLSKWYRTIKTNVSS